MPHRKKGTVSPEPPAAEAAEGRIVERPGGFYWQEKEGGEEYGPFPTRAEAEADMQSDGVGATDPDAVHDAESELGISEWIDPDSGEPAEDSVPRIEDH
jgi:hypothetical protein